MKTKRRKRVLVAGLSLAIGGTLAYIMLRGNLNYVHAAETLPQAKVAAINAFGTLTCEEYRAARGIAARDDTVAWVAFGMTIPSQPSSTILLSTVMSKKRIGNS